MHTIVTIKYDFHCLKIIIVLISYFYVCMAIKYIIVLFVETNLCGVSTNKTII